MTKLLRLFVIALAAGLVSGTVRAEKWTMVRIATEGAYPPFNYVDKDGKVGGFDVEIANALCEEMKVKCTIVAQNWDGIIPGLLAKKYDAIVASMAITEERKKKIDFSNPYYKTVARFMAKKGSGIVISQEGLKGKTIGVQRATIHANYLNDNYKGIVNIKEYDNYENAYIDLAAGRIDAVLDDNVAEWAFLKKPQGQDFEMVGPPATGKWFGEGKGIATRKEDKDLDEMFNKALAAILANGTYKKINAEYFPFDISPH
jgi:lysine-arginine-ornithine-binding protein